LHVLYPCTLSFFRWRFLLESLQDIDKRLRTFNSRLYVAQGQPVAVLEKLSDEWNVTSITFQRSGEPRSRTVEEAVEKLADVKGIQVRKRSCLCGICVCVGCSTAVMAVYFDLCRHTMWVVMVSPSGAQILSTHAVQCQQGAGYEQGPACDNLQRVQGVTASAWGTRAPYQLARASHHQATHL